MIYILITGCLYFLTFLRVKCSTLGSRVGLIETIPSFLSCTISDCNMKFARDFLCWGNGYSIPGNLITKHRPLQPNSMNPRLLQLISKNFFCIN